MYLLLLSLTIRYYLVPLLSMFLVLLLTLWRIDSTFTSMETTRTTTRKESTMKRTHLEANSSKRIGSGIVKAECGRRVNMMATGKHLGEITCNKCRTAGYARIFANDYEG